VILLEGMNQENLKILPRTENVAAQYNAASVVVNLTDKRLAIETFGLTALEAMSDGLPSVVPTEGGIAEVVEEGRTGFKIDVTDLDIIAERIDRMLTDRELYDSLAHNALKRSQEYDVGRMVDGIFDVLKKD
jgi:glycosyltransferase involved in cell wall biosynthesis